ncbi:hypothetical protein C1704_13680 [Caldimonas caldifontis]|uniref:Uncharacterized protein n=2 Tax=Caldimonas caldifontis TaxID=1452508 RepID=A0A2S5SSI0_9BURK|nr:hypothetical protein C1704_13680 [Caldimonas caldifontis]
MVAACTVLATSAATADVRPAPQEPTKTAVLDMGPGCRMSVTVPEAARESGSPEGGGSGSITIENPLNLKRKTYIEPFYLRFICYDADSEVVTNGWGKRLPSGEWVASVSSSDEPLFRGALRAHQVHSVNASGWAVAVDDVIGDERYRLRRLYYCVIHEPKAVCGHSEMGLLTQIRRHPKHDLTPYALKILRSIEFLDDAVQAAPAASR